MRHPLLLVALLVITAPLTQCKHSGAAHAADATFDAKDTTSDSESCPSTAALFLTEEKIKATLSEGRFVLISAGRNSMLPSDLLLSKREIQQRQCELAAALNTAGLTFSEAMGHYEGLDEQSFFVIDLTPEQQMTLLLLGARYQQDSIIVGTNGHNSMVFTSGCKVGQASVGQCWCPLDEQAKDYTFIQPSSKAPVLRFTVTVDRNKREPYMGPKAAGQVPKADCSAEQLKVLCR